MIICALSGAAQPKLTQSDVDALDLTRLDASLNEIALQIDRLRAVGGAPAPDPSFSGNTESDPSAPAPLSQRARSNAFCFSDSALGLETPEALDRYLEDLEALVERVDTTLAGFDSFTAVNPQGSCPTYMSDIILTVDRSLSTFSRRDISDLVFHLETCWPDDGVERQDRAPLDIDAQYARARIGLVGYGRSQRGFREASLWCE